MRLQKTHIKNLVFHLTFGVFAVFLCNEWFIYYLVLIQCSWPSLKTNVSSLDSLILADPHLLGSRHGHWWDKLRREWQMWRAFQTAAVLHRPEVVFVLGDLFDEGQLASEQEFQKTVDRFYSMFYLPKEVPLYVVMGNHDIGFHYYSVNRQLYKRFRKTFATPSVKYVVIKDNIFVLINSMAMEGDKCDMCSEAVNLLESLSKVLNCAKKGEPQCTNKLNASYSNPIVMQHFPMYRPSDDICAGPDAAPEEEKSKHFREKWECLSKESSEKIFSLLKPRAIFTGHTHHGCYVTHPDGTPEWTVPSFSWRNRNNPAYLLVRFTPRNVAANKCFMPEEDTVIWTYIATGAVLFLYFVTRIMKIKHRTN